MSSGPAAPPNSLCFWRRDGGGRQAPRTGAVPRGFGRRRRGVVAAALLVLSFPCFAQTRLSPESIFRSAIAAYRTPDYTRARDLFEKIVLENPLTPYVRESLFYLAECERVIGENAEAEKRYRTLLSLYPDSPYREASMFRLADLAWRAGDFSQGLAQVDLLRKQFPDGSFAGSAFLIAGNIHFAQKNNALALAEFDEAIARLNEGPDRQSAWYSKGLTLLALGRAADAQESFARAAAGTSADIAEKAGFRCAVLLVKAGRQQEAEAALGAFLNRFPGSVKAEEAAYLLASLLVKNGDSAGALVRWDSLVKGFPESDSLPEYISKRGEALLALDRLSAALDDFQAVLTRFPRSAWSAQCSYAVGYVYSRRAEYPRALPYFQAAAQNPWSTLAQDHAAGELAERSLLSLGICLYDMGSFEKALARLGELRARKPKSISDGAIEVLIGRTLYRMGRLDEAVLRLGEAAKVDASAEAAVRADAVYWLGWADLRLGRLVEARDAFLGLARAYPADPRCVESLLRAGICETMRGADPAAALLFNEVTAAPRSTANDEVREQALFEEGRALDRLARTQERTEVFERLAAEFPDGKLAPQAFFSLAERAYLDGRYADAGSGFLRVARDFPRSGLVLQALYWNAEARLQTGDARSALEGFWGCLAQGASAGLLTTATDALRAALRQTGDLELARRYADRAVGSKGLAVEAAAGIQLEYAQMLLESDPEGARAVINRVRRTGPPEPLSGEASLLQGRYGAAVGDWGLAADVFNSLKTTRTDEIGARAWIEHGRVLESTGHTAEAVDEWMAVSSRFPDFQDLAAEGLYHAGRVAHSRGDKGRAAAIQQILHKSYPDSPWVRKLDDTIR